jgi:hypothetical protein
MGVFDDKDYEALDWISQAVEPIKNPISDILAKLPDELVIDFNAYSSFKERSYSVGLDVQNIVMALADSCGEISYRDRDLLSNCFVFDIGEGTEIDFEKREIRGSIKLLKIKKQFEDKELEKTLGNKGLETLNNIPSWQNDLDVGRLNDIIDVLDANNLSRSSRSFKKKVKAIKFMVSAIFRDNKWKIRDSALADRFCLWIVKYVNDGSLAAYANICKLKLMTHKGLPIYSIKEDEV